MPSKRDAHARNAIKLASEKLGKGKLSAAEFLDQFKDMRADRFTKACTAVAEQQLKVGKALMKVVELGQLLGDARDDETARHLVARAIKSSNPAARDLAAELISIGTLDIVA